MVVGWKLEGSEPVFLIGEVPVMDFLRCINCNHLQNEHEKFFHTDFSCAVFAGVRVVHGVGWTGPGLASISTNWP